ncbi:MatE_and transmembrane domain-containing protein [Hexamita inflata]|uniref:MatE_and transmembrane domain-containing protein n=1 Tax=Hexamita inflata TaxID=28002 RepID=A0ABP1HWU1_9EUKA
MKYFDNTQDSESVASGASSIITNNFQPILIEPVEAVVAQTSILPLISQFSQGLFQILQLLLAYYYINYQAAIVIALTMVVTKLMQYAMISPIYGMMKRIQERMLAEQSNAPNILYQNTYVITGMLCVTIFVFMIIFGQKIANIYTAWAGDVTYFPLIVRGLPYINAIQYAVYIMICENKGNYLSLIEISQVILHLTSLYLAIFVLNSMRIEVTLRSFAIIDIAVNAVFAIVFGWPILKSTKSKKPITRFSLSLNTFRDMLLPVLFLALKQCVVYILGNLPEYVIPVLALILNFTQTETEQKNGMFLAFAFFVTYQQISSAVSRTIHAVLLQVFMPNVQMKRYERMTQFMTSGFGIIFGVSAVINIVLFVVCNQIVTVVFYDLKYNRADQQFIDGEYSIDSFYSIKYLAIEGIIRPIQSFVVYSSEITHNVGCYTFVVIVRYTATIGMFLIAYFTNVTKSIDYMVLAELSVDICCILPLISQIQHINNIKIKINTQEGFGMMLNNSISHSKHSRKNEEDLVFDMEQIKPMPLPSINMNRQQGLLGQSTTSIEPSSQLIEDKQIRDSNNKFTNSDSDLLKFAK